MNSNWAIRFVSAFVCRCIWVSVRFFHILRPCIIGCFTSSWQWHVPARGMWHESSMLNKGEDISEASHRPMKQILHIILSCLICADNNYSLDGNYIRLRSSLVHLKPVKSSSNDDPLRDIWQTVGCQHTLLVFASKEHWFHDKVFLWGSCLFKRQTIYIV